METIVDILAEMIDSIKHASHSAETNAVVAGYAVRLGEAYCRDLESQKETLNKIKEGLVKTREVFDGDY